MSCSEYAQEFQTSSANPDSQMKTEKCPFPDLIFDQTIVESSLTQYYDLVCQKSFLQSIFNSLYLVGMMIGSFLIGLISDSFGRLIALIVSIFLLGTSGILSALIDNQTLFAIFRVTSGIGGIGCYMVVNILATEATLPNYKIITTTISGIGFITGNLTGFMYVEWALLNREE